MTVLAVLVNAAIVAWATLVARGIRRSKRHGNIMASTFRRRHSWRWWLWTACARPRFWITWQDGHRAGVWVGHHRLPLPLAWFPAHMRRTRDEEALVSAKAAYVSGIIDLDELERRLAEALA